jgi:hypothetical protein
MSQHDIAATSGPAMYDGDARFDKDMADIVVVPK